MGFQAITTHYRIKIPKNFKIFWNNWVCSKDTSTLKISSEAFKNNNVWGNH